MDFTLAEIAEAAGGRVVGDGSRRVTGVTSLEAAGTDQLSFVVDARKASRATTSAAGALIVPPDVVIEGRDVIEHKSPMAAVVVAIGMFRPAEETVAGISPLAAVSDAATIAESASIGPFAVIDGNARIGEGCRIGAGSYVGPDCTVGDGTVVHPGVTLYARTRIGKGCMLHTGTVVGADGFGYTLIDGRHVKVPQLGGVEIGDDVEIGANSSIDAGTFHPTRIGDNTKIDNKVQVGHNCQVGKSVLLCSGTGLAGSSILEDFVVLAGHCGVADHVRVGRGVQAAAQTAIFRNAPAGQKMAGTPAVELGQWKRVWNASQKLPEMRRAFARLVMRVAELEERLGDGDTPN